MDKENKPPRGSDIRGVNWICTLNNPKVTLEEVHAATGARYTTGQMEEGKLGTKHLQFFQNFSKKVSLSTYKKANRAIHATVVLKDNGVQAYCNKLETRIEGPWTYGTKPMDRTSVTDWAEVLAKAKTGRIDEIPPDIQIRCYSSLKRIEKDNLVLKDAEGLRGVWCYGKAGCGKSRSMREKYPNAYPKLCNKWWDGYQNQEFVIMDDIGLDHKCLGQQLKIWSDRYACVLENKGGAMASNYKKFVVTSQYSIDDIWIGDTPTIEALKRRFEVIHIPFNLY